MLEPYAGKSLYENEGQRVVVGQRLMQSSSDIFLGWTRSRRMRDFFVRQLRDMKFSMPVEGMSPAQLEALCRSLLRLDTGARARQVRGRGDDQRLSGQDG